MMSKQKKNNKKGSQYRLNGASVDYVDTKLQLSSFAPRIWPDQYRCKLRYIDRRTIAASANIWEYVYRANSVFDPDFTGVGTQPDGFDQLALVYNIYRVVALGWKVTVTDQVALATTSLVAVPTLNSTSLANPEEAAGLRYATSSFTQAAGTPARVRGRVFQGDLFGEAQSAIMSPDYGAATSSNPAFASYLHITGETYNSDDNVSLYVELTYYVQFSQLLQTTDTLEERLVRVRSNFENRQRASQMSDLPSDSLPQSCMTAAAAPALPAHATATRQWREDVRGRAYPR